MFNQQQNMFQQLQNQFLLKPQQQNIANPFPQIKGQQNIRIDQNNNNYSYNKQQKSFLGKQSQYMQQKVLQQQYNQKQNQFPLVNDNIAHQQNNNIQKNFMRNIFNQGYQIQQNKQQPRIKQKFPQKKFETQVSHFLQQQDRSIPHEEFLRAQQEQIQQNNTQIQIRSEQINQKKKASQNSKFNNYQSYKIPSTRKSYQQTFFDNEFTQQKQDQQKQDQFPSKMNVKFCKFFQKGYCKHGDKCKQSHGKPKVSILGDKNKIPQQKLGEKQKTQDQIEIEKEVQAEISQQSEFEIEDEEESQVENKQLLLNDQEAQEYIVDNNNFELQIIQNEKKIENSNQKFNIKNEFKFLTTSQLLNEQKQFRINFSQKFEAHLPNYKFNKDTPMIRTENYENLLKNPQYINCFELDPNSYSKDDKKLQNFRPQQNLCIEPYQRSDAGRKYDDTIDLQTLQKIWELLKNRVIDADNSKNEFCFKMHQNKNKHSFNCIYQYVTNRIRMILLNIKNIQDKKNPTIIKLYEEMIRFLIILFHSNRRNESNDDEQNLKLITNFLSDLISRYEFTRNYAIQYLKLFNFNADTKNYITNDVEKLHQLFQKEKIYISPNEAEFLSYEIIILGLTKEHHLAYKLQSLYKKQYKSLRKSQYITEALKIVTSLITKSSSVFFKLLQNANYLTACIMSKHIKEMRKHKFELIQTLSFKKNGINKYNYNLEDITKMLYFDRKSETIDFLTILHEEEENTQKLNRFIQQLFYNENIPLQQKKCLFLALKVPESQILISSKMNFNYNQNISKNDLTQQKCLKRIYFVEKRDANQEQQLKIEKQNIQDLFSEIFLETEIKKPQLSLIEKYKQKIIKEVRIQPLEMKENSIEIEQLQEIKILKEDWQRKKEIEKTISIQKQEQVEAQLFQLFNFNINDVNKCMIFRQLQQLYISYLHFKKEKEKKNFISVKEQFNKFQQYSHFDQNSINLFLRLEKNQGNNQNYLSSFLQEDINSKYIIVFSDETTKASLHTLLTFMGDPSRKIPLNKIITSFNLQRSSFTHQVFTQKNQKKLILDVSYQHIPFNQHFMIGTNYMNGREYLQQQINIKESSYYGLNFAIYLSSLNSLSQTIERLKLFLSQIATIKYSCPPTVIFCILQNEEQVFKSINLQYKEYKEQNENLQKIQIILNKAKKYLVIQNFDVHFLTYNSCSSSHCQMINYLQQSFLQNQKQMKRKHNLGLGKIKQVIYECKKFLSKKFIKVCYPNQPQFFLSSANNVEIFLKQYCYTKQLFNFIIKQLINEIEKYQETYYDLYIPEEKYLSKRSQEQIIQFLKQFFQLFKRIFSRVYEKNNFRHVFKLFKMLLHEWNEKHQLINKLNNNLEKFFVIEINKVFSKDGTIKSWNKFFKCILKIIGRILDHHFEQKLCIIDANFQFRFILQKRQLKILQQKAEAYYVKQLQQIKVNLQFSHKKCNIRKHRVKSNDKFQVCKKVKAENNHNHQYTSICLEDQYKLQELQIFYLNE